MKMAKMKMMNITVEDFAKRIKADGPRVMVMDMDGKVLLDSDRWENESYNAVRGFQVVTFSIEANLVELYVA